MIARVEHGASASLQIFVFKLLVYFSLTQQSKQKRLHFLKFAVIWSQQITVYYHLLDAQFKLKKFII